ncbi:MAG: OsmC family protein [Polyangiales bacterium]|nr:OsmC family protein [Myxococcales bacterium]
MSEHTASIRWERTTPDFKYATYTRDHDVAYGTGTSMRVSAAPAFKGNPELVNPEELFVAALSSCHMLTFLAVAARDGFVVDRYEDNAVGVLGKNAQGRMAMTTVTLRPRVTFAGEAPDAASLSRLHDTAHHGCFIAQSVTTEVTVEPAA